MLFLSSAPAQQPDYVALAMVLVLFAIVAVMAIRKRFAPKKAPKSEPAITAAPIPMTVKAPAAAAPGSAGKLKLHDVPPKTAAMLMAITADKLNKPLNELRFISIKEVK